MLFSDREFISFYRLALLVVLSFVVVVLIGAYATRPATSTHVKTSQAAVQTVAL